MSKGNTFENDVMKLIFNATAIANLADNAASSPLTNLYVSLHTGDPGEAGDREPIEFWQRIVGHRGVGVGCVCASRDRVIERDAIRDGRDDSDG